MVIAEIIKKAMLVGLGAQEKAKEFVEELVKAGELSKSEASTLVQLVRENREAPLRAFRPVVQALGNPGPRLEIGAWHTRGLNRGGLPLLARPAARDRDALHDDVDGKP